MPGAEPKRDESFRQEDRLRKRREFLRVQGRGAKVHTRHLLGLALPSAAGRRRVGLTVSTKVGGAVVRNRIKRRLREIYRKERDALPPRIDLVLVAKSGAAHASFDTLREEFLEIARRVATAPPTRRRKGR